MVVMGSVEKKKRVRVSKNRKKNWNKHCDVKDVEDFLEEKRFDERIGGAVSEKSDAELFFIETDVKTKEESKAGKKQLRCFQNIGSYSKVPALHTRTLQPYSKKIKNVITRADVRRSKRTLASASNQKKEVQQNLQVGDLFSADLKDLWGEEKEVDPDFKDLITFRDEYTCKRAIKVPGHRFQKPSLLPAVEVPHSGASYNPDFEDHQDLLREAVIIEEAKLKKELHLKRVLTDMFPSKAEAPTQESILKEMSQGLFEEPDTEEEEEKDGENSLYSRNPPVSYEDRITKSRKRRKKERKEKERLKVAEKLQKKRINEVFRIKTLKSEIVQEAVAVQRKVERNLKRKVDRMYKPKTLSKHKYEAPDLEVNLSEELSGSLRTLKTEGNLLEDRYKSLQRRNLIEPRIMQKRKRKYRLKVQVKRNHRDFK